MLDFFGLNLFSCQSGAPSDLLGFSGRRTAGGEDREDMEWHRVIMTYIATGKIGRTAFGRRQRASYAGSNPLIKFSILRWVYTAAGLPTESATPASIRSTAMWRKGGRISSR